jgi:adenylate kinase family enzyme
MKKKISITVELVGPPGAGKTTIRKALLERDSRVLMQPHPDLSKQKDRPFYAWNLLKVVPLLARMALVKDGLKINGEELANIVILHGWADPLKRLAANHRGVVLLDQGPIYLLSVLFFFRAPVFQFPVLAKWWETLYQKWAKMVDVVIQLDTADEVLIERINTRGKWHQMVGKDDETAEEFLKVSRFSLDETIARLCRRNPEMQILQFNTREKSADQITTELTAFFDSQLA